MFTALASAAAAALTPHSWSTKEAHLLDNKYAGDFRKEGLLHWHAPAIAFLKHECNGKDAHCDGRDLYTFGVYTGRTMRGIAMAMNASGIPYRRFWGFDSFEGLPDASADTTRSNTSQWAWQPGDWSVADVLNNYDADAVQQTVKKYISEPRVELVAGYYSDTLGASLVKARGMRPALFVEIDCDLYISSVQALDFMLAHRLIGVGTVVGYDDFATGDTDGEARAHREMSAKYGLRFERLVKKGEAKQIFVVREAATTPVAVPPSQQAAAAAGHTFTSVAPCSGERAALANDAPLASTPHAHPPTESLRMSPSELHDVQSLVTASQSTLLLGLHAADLAVLEALDAPRVIAAGPDVLTSRGARGASKGGGDGGGFAASMRCDFARSELPLDLSPPPQVIVAHYAFKVATDLQLVWRATRCAYPNATIYVTATEPPGGTWRHAICAEAEEGEVAEEEGEVEGEEEQQRLAMASKHAKYGKLSRVKPPPFPRAPPPPPPIPRAPSMCGVWDVPGTIFPSPFALTKFAMADTARFKIAEVENHYQRRWLLPDGAASLGVRATLRRSGLVMLVPDESAGGGRFGAAHVCHGAPSLDARGMLHDCTGLLAPPDAAEGGGKPRQHQSDPWAALRQHWATRDDAVAARQSNTVEWFEGLSNSGAAFSDSRNDFFVAQLPNRSRVLELGAGAEQLGAALLRSRCGVHYCPTDAVPRSAPYRAAVCDLNAGGYPLSLHPPPTHIVAQGVLVYVLDRYTFMRALRCAYPDATWLLSAATGLSDAATRTELASALADEFGLHMEPLFATMDDGEQLDLMVLTPVRSRTLASLGCAAHVDGKEGRRHAGTCYASPPCSSAT